MTAGSATIGADTPPGGTTATGPAGTGRHTSTRPKRAVGRPARLSLSNWPVSARLVAIFVVASVTGLVFGGLRVADAISTSDAYSRTAQLAVLGKQVTLLEQDLENERDLTIGAAALTALQQDAAAAKAGPAVTASLRHVLAAEEGQLADAQRATSAAAAPVQQLAQDVVSNSAFPASIQGGANSVVAQTAALEALRLEVLGRSPTLIINDYSGTLSALFALNDELTGSSGDALLSDEVRALGGLSRAKDQAAQQRAILYAAFLQTGMNDAGGQPTNADPTGAPYNNLSWPVVLDFAGGLQALSTAQDLQLIDLDTFQVSATPADFEAYLATVAGAKVQTAQTVNNMVTAANGNTQAIFPQITELSPGFDQATAPARWYADQSTVVDAMRTIENQLATQIVTRSQFLQHQAFDSAVVTSVVTIAAVLLVLLATALVVRTLVNPLRRLQADALEIATVRLPARVAAAAAGTETVEGSVVEPIGVQSTDEIGRVARAFDQVHAEAVRLAGTEAQLRGSLNAMFISLSRRSVPLIERLSRVIDTMEQSEDDPDQLAKLFSMDHMVTRMRRNSENLLVLAGEEPVRKWTESVPLADVARAAASEIEQYGRVALAVQPGIMISGHAAADVVHLLAELIENATLFSPQHTQVRVTVMELGSGGVLVEVRDEGVGVSPSRLTDMNWRLDHPPLIDESISRHMGLYAVSRLAVRHGIRVRLRPGTPQGLSALVWLPSTLAKREPTPAAGNRTRPLGADARGPVAGIRPTAGSAGRHGPGRHRIGLLAARDEQPLADGRETQVARPAKAWFAAKRPSSGAANSPEQLTADWQRAANSPAMNSMAMNSMAMNSMAMNSMAAADGPGAAEQAGRTAAGLPRRMPRTSAYPGSDTPGSGMPAAVAADAVGSAVPVLGAPPGGRAAAGIPNQEAPHQEQVPSRRRSPEAARSRLTGFQLGSRDAVEAGHTASWTPPAGEENSR